MSSFQMWCLPQVSKVGMGARQQRAEKARHFEKIQLGEHLATNEVNWHQVCNMISSKILEKLRWTEALQFVKECVTRLWNTLKTMFINIKFQRLCKSHHLQCITSSKDLEKRKGQGRRPLLDTCGLRTLRWNCITHLHDSVIDITKWAQEYFQKPLSVNTMCHLQMQTNATNWAKRKPYVNMVQKRRRVLWAETHLKWTVSKCSMVRRVQIWNSCWKSRALSSGLKRRETFQHVISIQFKSQHLWWHGGACGMDSLHV